MLQIAKKKIIFALLCACICTMPIHQYIIVYAEDDTTQQLNIIENKVNGECILDVSEVGNVDWVHNATNNLKTRETNIMIDFIGPEKSEYSFGHLKDQQDRYQTFTANENFTMEYVQVLVKKIATDCSDLVVRLYETNSNGLPIGSPLTKTTVNENNVINGELTTAKLSYDLIKNVRYAIVLSQANLANEKYRWIVTDKKTESENEDFGKTVSGKFVSEGHLGTGILRIIKNTNVDRIELEKLIQEAKSYNKEFYTKDSWILFETTLVNAEKCINNFDSIQEEVDEAIEQLQNKINNLKLNIYISDIDKEIAKFDGVTIKGYTEISVNNVNKAIEFATGLGENASEIDKIEAYVNIKNEINKLEEVGKYQYQLKPQMTAAFGFEGDKNAPLAYLDGSYQIGGRRPMQYGYIAPKQMVTFGVTNTDNIKWYNKEGYLPCFVSEYTKDNVEYVVENFANKANVDSKDYVIAYSRVTATNNSDEKRLLPLVSNNLIPLNNQAKSIFVIEPGETVVRDYAIEADKYEYFESGIEEFASLTREEVINQGTFDENYSGMKTYWDTELNERAVIDLPNQELVNAYKAGYIYTMIIKDKTYLHVGENGYARLFSHDTLGILVSLIQSGDFEQAKDYLESVPLTGGKNIESGQIDPNQYWDANWKLPWAYAVYLSKTGDISIFSEEMIADNGVEGTVFNERIKFTARSIENDRLDNGDNDNDVHDGIMKYTTAIDARGQWTIDNYSALIGLVSYEYICRELYNHTNDNNYMQEAEWARKEYDELLEAFTSRLQQTIDQEDLNYIPVSVTQSNDKNRCNNPKDANWASMFLFGRWTWDGYLFGAEQSQENINISMLDQTYTYGINRRFNTNNTDSPYNFGGYPHGWYSSSYNAGYGSAALRGEEYRDMGIKAYEFMIENSMSAPFSWWEGIYYPDEGNWAPTNNSLNIKNTPGGGGSAQHMWGQSVISKVLLDSLIAERIYNKNKNIDIIVGRGIPMEWVADTAQNNNVVVDVQNYPVLQGGRVSYKIVREGNDLVITFDRNLSQAMYDNENTAVNFSIQLPSMVKNITNTTAGDINNEKGIVTVPINTNKVIITLGNVVKSVDKAELQKAYDSVKDLQQGLYTDETWFEFESARTNAKIIIDNPNITADEVNSALLNLNNAIENLEKIDSTITVFENQVNGQYTFNLSEVGSIDWLHLKGNGMKNLTQIKKADSNIIDLEYKENTGIEGKLNRGNDVNYVSYTWNDGMEGYESGIDDTGFGVFFPKDSRDAGTCENVGWELTVASQSQDIKLVFNMGIWNAKVDVKFYVDDRLVEIHNNDAKNIAQVYEYQVSVPANKTLKVEAEQKQAISNSGNFSLSGVAVGN